MRLYTTLRVVATTWLLAGLAPVRVGAQTPTVFAPGIISGPNHDSAPAFTPDGQTVYFARSNAASSTILVSHWRAATWSTPQVAAFSGQWNDMEPAMSPDGSFLVFISSRPAAGTGAAASIDGAWSGQAHPGQGGHAWRVARTASGWSEPTRLPDCINRSNNVFAPSVARDGSLYFMEASGEKQRFRLFRSQYQQGHYQEPAPLPFSDGTATDVDPAVAPDESYLVFGSGRAPAKGIDLFLVFRQNGAWGTPVHLGADLNSPGSDAEPRLSPDGKALYFSSDRVVPATFPRQPAAARTDLERMNSWDTGNYNIWQVSLINWLKEISP